MANEKTCKRCGETKAADSFTKNAAHADGLNDFCKDCNKAYRQDLRSRKGEPRKTDSNGIDASPEALAEVQRAIKTVAQRMTRAADRRAKHDGASVEYAEIQAGIEEDERVYNALAAKRDRIREKLQAATVAGEEGSE